MTNDELNKMIESFLDEDDGISIDESHKLICGLIEREKELIKSHSEFYQMLKDSLISRGRNKSSDFIVIDALISEYESVSLYEKQKNHVEKLKEIIKMQREALDKLKGELK